ncbi:uncharacterized protein LOC131209465 [Anopheles bellator]|uniref:uncharacterized protein LOC131209465 n=1 Tax=Anopheles bellator TaxID=139047 RepID=UPI0026498512|nr:uncharacterized protein LOC131209465 [Anopheles bellator]
MSKPVEASLPAYISVGLQLAARKEGFTDGQYRLKTEPGSKEGDGFSGQMIKVFIREARREVIVLCKVLPDNQVRKEQGVPMFERETEVYVNVLPFLLDFQRDKALESECPQFDNVPRCYFAKTSVDTKEAVIIMEDLRAQAYRLWDKTNTVNLEHAELLMATIGRLHAISFAIKEQLPEKFAECTGKLVDPMATLIQAENNGGFDRIMATMWQRAVDVLEPHDTLHREKLNLLKDRCCAEIISCVEAKAAEPYAIIGHGDCWSNNMMFQYGDDDKTPINIKLIDWQLCRYCSPVLDLVYFIFNCTDEELRAHSYHRLLNVYYNILGVHLHRLSGNVERQFPRSAFRDQLKRFGRYGLVMSFLVLPIICTPNDELPDTDSAIEDLMKEISGGTGTGDFTYGTTEKAATRYKERMSGTIRDVIRLGYM